MTQYSINPDTDLFKALLCDLITGSCFLENREFGGYYLVPILTLAHDIYRRKSVVKEWGSIWVSLGIFWSIHFEGVGVSLFCLILACHL